MTEYDKIIWDRIRHLFSAEITISAMHKIWCVTRWAMAHELLDVVFGANTKRKVRATHTLNRPIDMNTLAPTEKINSE